MALIRNDLAHKPLWTVQEAITLRELVATNYTYGGKVWDDQVPRPQLEAYGRQSMGVATIAERFALGFPVDPQAKEILKAALVDLLGSPMWQARLLATTGLVQGDLAKDPITRSRVEQMRRDPDPDVAANAARQLDYRDELFRAKTSVPSLAK